MMSASWKRWEHGLLILYAMGFYAIVIRRSLHLSWDHSARLYGLRPGWISNRQNEMSVSIDRYSYRMYLCYLIYASLYIAGPIISFNAFTAQCLRLTMVGIIETSSPMFFDSIIIGSHHCAIVYSLKLVDRTTFIFTSHASSRQPTHESPFAEEVLGIVGELYGDGKGGFRMVDMRSTLSMMAFNMAMRLIAGERYYKRGKPMELTDEDHQFWHIIWEGAFLNCVTGFEESIPLLRWFGVGRAHKKRLLKLERKIDDLMKELIEKGRRERANAVGEKDDGKRSLVDGMLTLQEKEGESCSELLVKGVIMTVIMPGVHTMSSSMEWVMSFLLNHLKVWEEVDMGEGLGIIMQRATPMEAMYKPRGVMIEVLSRQLPNGAASA